MPARTLLRQDQGKAKPFSFNQISASPRCEATLALTGRYTLCKPPSLQELSAAEAEGKDWAASATFQGHPNYRRTPPDLSLITAALLLIEDVYFSTGYTSASDPTLISTLMSVLETEKRKFSGDRGSSGSLDTCYSESSPVSSWQLQSLFQCLTQTSFQSWTSQDRCRSTRTHNMAQASLQAGHELVMAVSTWNASEKDARALSCSHVFADMRFGEENLRGDIIAIQMQEECTRVLLTIRMVLRSEPFIVICQGAAHMASFMQLAKSCELHLELLPSEAHVRCITR